MSEIPSSTGPDGGLTRKLDKFGSVGPIGTIGNPSVLKATNVSEYDEVTLNVRCFNNFSFPGGGFTFATSINIEILYSTVNEFRAPPPHGPADHGVFWSKILAESLISPFSGATEVASYTVGLKNIQTGSSLPGAPGPVTPLNFSLRIPVIMAQWIIPVVSVDTLGLGGAPASQTYPLVGFSLYRGVTI